jgi:hypothetical protein
MKTRIVTEPRRRHYRVLERAWRAMALGALRNRERGQFKKSLILARPEPAPLAIEPPKWEFLKGREPAVSVERDSRALRGLCSLGFGALLLFGIIKVLWPGGDPMAEELAASRFPRPHHLELATKPPFGVIQTEDTDPLRLIPPHGGPLELGAHYFALLPDLRSIVTTYLGNRATFADLPKDPHLGDMFRVSEAPGTYWIWAVPIGFKAPAWVDP